MIYLVWLLLWFSSLQSLLCLLSINTKFISYTFSLWNDFINGYDYFMDFFNTESSGKTSEGRKLIDFIFSMTMGLINQIPVLCKSETYGGIEIVEKQISCEKFVGYLSVYRIQFSLACFFFLMMILMLCVKRSKDPRTGIQNG